MKSEHTQPSEKLPTHNQIAWNLLAKYMDDPTKCSYLETIEEISRVTGVKDRIVSKMFEKQAFVYLIHQMPQGIESAKQVIDEIENNKPHYEIDIEGIE